MHREIRLSELLGVPIDLPGGERIGRIIDVRVRLTGDAPRVGHLVVGSRRRATHLVPWPLVDHGAGARPGLGGDLGAADLEACRIGEAGVPTGADVLLLRRDVLDSQVIDLSGRRLTRVADVVLEQADDGDLRVVAVDVGLGALLDRVGLGRIGRRLPTSLVAWSSLHLVSEQGHMTQLTASEGGLRRLDAHDLADVVARVRTEQATDILRAVEPSDAAVALEASHEHVRHRLERALNPDDAAPVRRRFRRTAGWRTHRPPSSAA